MLMYGSMSRLSLMLMVAALSGCTSVVRIPDPPAGAALSGGEARSQLKRLLVGKLKCRVVSVLGCSGGGPIRSIRFKSGEAFELDAGSDGVSEVQYRDLMDPVVHHRKPSEYWIELLAHTPGLEGLSIRSSAASSGEDVFVGIARALAVLKKAPPGERVEGGPSAPAFGSTGGGAAVAVAQFEAQSVSAGDAAVISDLFRSEMIRQGTFQVVEKASMEKILQEQAFQQTGCTSQECAVKLGKILNVKYLILGSFGKLLDRYVLNIRVVEIETARGVYSDNEQGKDVSDIQQGIVRLATRLSAAVTTGK